MLPFATLHCNLDLDLVRSTARRQAHASPFCNRSANQKSPSAATMTSLGSRTATHPRRPPCQPSPRYACLRAGLTRAPIKNKSTCPAHAQMISTSGHAPSSAHAAVAAAHLSCRAAKACARTVHQAAGRNAEASAKAAQVAAILGRYLATAASLQHGASLGPSALIRTYAHLRCPGAHGSAHGVP